MRALVVSPDYASHYLPLSALGHALAARGHEVVVASGPALADRIRQDGFVRRELVLGPGNNPGLIRAGSQPADEEVGLEGFLDATRRGMVATLRHQAESRLHDLLWRPEAVTERLAGILSEVRPDVVVSDQLAFGATLALRALEQPYVSFHPGHPAAIPGPGELFGFPAHRPREFRASAGELGELRQLCAEVSDHFTLEFNETLRTLNPDAAGVESALSATSPHLTLLNYPAQLGAYRRPLLPLTARFIGAAVREPSATGRDADGILAAAGGRLPRVYVSLGTFLSARSDVLRRITEAFRNEPVELAVASGATPPEALGEVPDSWHVQPFLPQPAVLRHCDLAVTHGGNNTITEALWAGAPLLVCPFSTDQFAGAEDVRVAGLGDVFDPNRASAAEIAARARGVLRSAAPRRAAALGARLRARPGSVLAAVLVERVAQGGRRTGRPGRRPRPGTAPGRTGPGPAPPAGLPVDAA